jgi:hypothetical protein
MAFEVEVRVEDWIRFRMPPTSRYRSIDDLLVRDSEGVHGRPGGHFRKWKLNALGFRGPEIAPGKPPQVRRVLVSGASETFGLYESSEHEYPRLLEALMQREIERRCGSSIGTVQVINAAHAGLSLPTVVDTIGALASRLQADLVVYYPTPAQYLTDDAPVRAEPDRSGRDTSLPAWNALYPRGGRRAWTSVKALVPALLEIGIRRREIDRVVATKPAGWRFADVPGERLEQYRRDLRSLIAVVQSAQARPVLVTHVHAFRGALDTSDRRRLAQWEFFYPRASGSVILAFESAAGEATRQVASRDGVPLIDLARAFPRSDDAFADFAHFTDTGARSVASILAPPLVDLLCADARPSQRAQAQPR